MSIFIDEDTPVSPMEWDKDASFSHNLDKINSLFYDLVLRNKIVEDKPEIAKVAKDFVKQIGDMLDIYEAKVRKIKAEEYAAIPSKLSKEDFINKSVDILELCSDFGEKFEYLNITKEELRNEENFIKHLSEFGFYLDQSVRFSFENFYPKRIVETDIGTFLFACAYGDWEHPVFFFMYLSEEDPNKFFTYIPQDGNYWNSKTRWAYDNEGYPRDERQYNKKAMLEELLAFFGGKEWK